MKLRYIITFLLTGLLVQNVLVAQEEEEPHKTVLGMMAGMGYGQLRSNDETDKEFNFSPAYTKYAGVTLDVPIPKLEKKGSFYNEFTFSQFEANSLYHFSDSTQGFPERDYYEVTQRFSPNILTLAHTFRYCFTKSDFKYYVSVGFYNSFVLGPVNRKITTHMVNGVASSNREDMISDPAVHGLMLLLGTGIAYRYFGLELRFDPGRNFTKKVDYSVYNPTIAAILHLRFNP
jgi:hypothetical protein